LRALEYCSRHVGCETPLIRSIMPSNTIHIDRMAQRVMDAGRRSVGLLGLSFKPGIDDLRESPLVELARILLDKGLDLRIFDEDVRLEKLTGANRRFITRQIPKLDQVTVSVPEELFRHSELIIVGKLSPFALESLRRNVREDHVLLDLVGIPDMGVRERTCYSGLCW
jgi:GDP-mannose 6-dehydrogenase